MQAPRPALSQTSHLPPICAAIERSDPGLSAECLVPDTELFALAPLEVVKTALDEKRPVKILVLGSSAMSALGTGSANYPAWLERELERLLPGSDFVMEHRALSGEVLEDASDRLKNIVAEVEPDLVIWKVGTRKCWRELAHKSSRNRSARP